MTKYLKHMHALTATVQSKGALDHPRVAATIEVLQSLAAYIQIESSRVNTIPMRDSVERGKVDWGL